MACRLGLKPPLMRAIVAVLSPCTVMPVGNIVGKYVLRCDGFSFYKQFILAAASAGWPAPVNRQVLSQEYGVTERHGGTCNISREVGSRVTFRVVTCTGGMEGHQRENAGFFFC